MLMGKKTKTIRYETVVQLLVLAVVILTPYLAINLMDLDLFSVSKSTFTTLRSSINPWFLINFMIIIIFVLSIIHSNTIFFNPSNDDDHISNESLLDDSFMEPSLVSQNLVVESNLLDDDSNKFHALDDTFQFRDHDDDIKVEDMFKDRDRDHDRDIKVDTSKDRNHDDDKKLHTIEDTFRDWDDVKINKLRNKSMRKSKEVVPESVVDKRELRKSRTFHEGGSMHRIRAERYVKILSHEELDRQVEAFIDRFKKK